MNKKNIIKLTTIIVIIVVSYFTYKIINKKNKTIVKQETIQTSNNQIQNENTISHDKELKEEIIGTLEIPKINLVGPIKDGSDSNVLRDYIGHIEETPIYDGNVGLAAHNRGNKYSYFAKLNELVKGDKITYKTKFGEAYYTVNKITEIDEKDWSLLEDTEKNKLTLITCIKNKRTKRLCVQALKDE